MRVFFESQVQSFFPVWKLTLVPGENVIPNKSGEALLEAHEAECVRSGDKPRIKRLAELRKPEAKPKPSVVTSATSKVDKDKKGVK